MQSFEAWNSVLTWRTRCCLSSAIRRSHGSSVSESDLAGKWCFVAGFFVLSSERVFRGLPLGPLRRWRWRHGVLSKRLDTSGDPASDPRVYEMLYRVSSTKSEVLILCKEVVSVCSENSAKDLNTLWWNEVLVMLAVELHIVCSMLV
jgi:hypothetical protein